MFSATRDPPGDMSMRGASTPFGGPGASPSPGQYQAHMTPHFQPASPGMSGPPVHQTPVPIPQPPQHTPHPPQMSIRPMHYQQSYPQHGGAAYSQSPAPSVHHPTPMHNPLTPGYGQGPPPPGSRSGALPLQGNPMAHNNMYIPPRPPEVYTLPDAVNESLPENLRVKFRHDDAGRVLFFTAPPLDRTYARLSPSSAGLGHSAKYLAGRREWLDSRDKKRKLRDEQYREKARRLSTQDTIQSSDLGSSIVSQAAEAMEKWFQTFDRDTAEWKSESGLDGWRGIV